MPFEKGRLRTVVEEEEVVFDDVLDDVFDDVLDDVLDEAADDVFDEVAFEDELFEVTDSDEASSEVAVSSEVSVSLEGSSALEEPPKIIELPNRLPAIDDLFDDALPVAELSAQEQTDSKIGVATAMHRMRKNKAFFIKHTILSLTLLYNKQILFVNISQPRLSGY